jgi:hypothetical protein
MTVFAGAVDAIFAVFGADALYTPASGDPIQVRAISRRPDTIVGFGEMRIHAETATFEVRRARSGARTRVISSPSVAIPSLSRASRNGAIPTGSSGASIPGRPEQALDL